jgi:hypothetical protein
MLRIALAALRQVFLIAGVRCPDSLPVHFEQNRPKMAVPLVWFAEMVWELVLFAMA